MLHCLRSVWLVLCLACLGARAVAAEPVVMLVASELGGGYSEAVDALSSELERGGVPRKDIQLVMAADLPTGGAVAPKLFIALGTEAARILARRSDGALVLCTLLPREAFEQVLRESGRRASGGFAALYLDQPIGRQLDLLRLALPQTRRVGMLWGPDFQAWAGAVEAAIKGRGWQFTGAHIEPGVPLYPSLKRVLEEADVLLAVPDRQLYNSTTIQNILLASFRARVPMVAFSPAYVRTGALLGLYSTAAQVGRQAGGIALGVLRGKTSAIVSQYPQEFTVGVNDNVARSLGLALDGASLTEALRRQERGR
jgi:ABC-type uncharacterized transport system substrate-binding protein